ncbi:hypothetical protein ACFS27_14150 [Promicromonospora vindobonensis]|uniref:Gram-positive cocci surface proteins LPxTG domain-containing protein n=1 Tax=Promicromonospora vindobonensis TaxID=195748 RepID=A0ABW5VX90_9MICO
MTPARCAALIALLVACVAGVLPAHSAVLVDAPDGPDRLVLSVDGSTWTPDVTTPLLDPDLVWVPGDVATGTLYARNVSGEDATAAVTVHLDGGPDGAGDPLVDELDVRVRTGSGPWTDGPTAAITDLPPGEELPIGIEVRFDPAATNASQLRTARIGVAVLLSAVGPGPDGGGADSDRDPGATPGEDAPGSLPRTGANLLLAALVAVGAVALGVFLRGAARRG